jgi:dephospho-CoA kinase
MTLTETRRSSAIPFETLKIYPPKTNISELDAGTLNNYLGALFLDRETLRVHWGKNSSDLAAFDSIMSAVLMHAIDRRGLSQLMGEAQMLGWVENGADIIPIIEPHLRAHYENLKVGNKEQLSNIPTIGVVGKIASGKGTVAETLSRDYDVISFPFSDRLRSLALAMGYRAPFTREQLRTINDIYKPAFGNQVFVEWTLIQAARMTQSLHVPQIIVPDGFRSVEETEYFLNQPNTHLVAIIASHDTETDRQIRFQRQKNRHRGSEDSLTMEKFMKDDEIESIWIDPVVELAKQRGRVIINDGDLEDLSRKVMSELEDLLPVII